MTNHENEREREKERVVAFLFVCLHMVYYLFSVHFGLVASSLPAFPLCFLEGPLSWHLYLASKLNGGKQALGHPRPCVPGYCGQS